MPPTPQALFWDLARALAAGRTVLVVGEPAEAVGLLAQAALKGLIVVSPDADPGAPDATTAAGAPFRMRADWGEKRGSIGLILDGEGYVPPEEATRLLSASGLYLTRTTGPAWTALPVRRTLDVLDVAGLALPGDAPSPGDAFADRVEGTVVAQFHLAGRRRIPPVPRVLRLAAPVEAPPGPTEPKAEHDALVPAWEAEWTACRDALALCRARDRRADLLAARLQTERGRFLAEIDGLERRLAAVEGPHAELEAAESARRHVEETLDAVLSGLTSVGPSGGLPPPPAAAGEAVRLWLEGYLRALRGLNARHEQQTARLEALERALADARAAAEAALSAPSPVSPPDIGTPEAGPVPSVPRSEAHARADALEGVLSAVEALRLTEQAELSRLRRTAESSRRRLAEEVRAREALRRQAALETIARARAEEALHVARASEREHAARADALELLAAEHGRMSSLLTDALAKALADREAAVHERRLADESLRRLRAGEDDR
jgi:hypothetical protein